MRHAYTWWSIAAVVLSSTAGDALISAAMKRIGSVGALWRNGGFRLVAARVLRNPLLGLGIVCMAFSFFALLTALSWADVSLVAPTSASLTYITNTMVGKFLLRERVDHRRWVAAVLVAGGVALIAL